MMKYSIQAVQSASDSNIMITSAAEYARLLLQRFLATRDEPLVCEDPAKCHKCTKHNIEPGESTCHKRQEISSPWLIAVAV